MRVAKLYRCGLGVWVAELYRRLRFGLRIAELYRYDLGLWVAELYR
jgi:hypothetical protein